MNLQRRDHGWAASVIESSIETGEIIDSPSIGSASFMIDEAASVLSQAEFEGVALDFSGWRDVIVSTLLDSDWSVDRTEVAKRGLLGRACAFIDPKQYASLTRTLGSFAKVGHLRFVLGLPSGSDPLRLVRGALAAYSAVLSGTFIRGGPSRLMTPLALWALGVLGEDDLSRRLHSPDRFGRSEMKQLARQPGWTAMLAVERVADIRWLLKLNPREARTVDLVLAVCADRKDLVDAVLSADALAASAADDSVAHLVAAHRLEDPGLAWVDASSLGSDGAAMLSRLAQLALDRRDFLLSGSRVLVVEPQGFMDALLALAVDSADDERNSNWHERAVHREAREVWGRRGQVLANIEWTDSQPAESMIPAPKVAGEFDSLFRDDRVIIDIQAKSSRSGDPTTREKLPVTGAMRQHQRFLEEARRGKPIWLLKDGRKTTRLSRVTRLETSGLETIPITVGTDVVQRWQVGGSMMRDGVARVLTTLDHMRVVNHYVPELLRPVYWLDRYAQEYDPIVFIDEIDFLVKWLRLASLGKGNEKVRIAGGFVLASNSELERDLTFRNSWALTKNPDPLLARALTASREPIARMNTELKTISCVLGLNSIKNSAEYWMFARSIVGNVPSTVHDALLRESPTILHQGIARIGIHAQTLTPEEIERYRDHGVTLVLARVKSSWRLANISREGVDTSTFATPRFDSSGHEWRQ